MVDTLLCFSCPEDRAEDFLVALIRDIYENPTTEAFAGGTPFYRKYKRGKVLFLCPFIIPVPIPLVAKVLLKAIWNKFKVSGRKASKGAINLQRVKTTEELKSEYDEYFQKNL